MNKDDVLARLRPEIRESFEEIEAQTGLCLAVGAPPTSFNAIAGYSFTPPATARILLKDGWEDVDVAHELIHIKMELLEGYGVLAWRTGITSKEHCEPAMRCVRAYVDDEAVHRKLKEEVGLRVDGEILRPQLFKKRYDPARKQLRKGAPCSADAMDDFDASGYGSLFRAAVLVQAQLVLEQYSGLLTPQHRKTAQRFVKTFRKALKEQAQVADRVLELFERHDVHTPEGHRAILWGWATMEHLDNVVGVSVYERATGGFRLPWPDET